VPASSDALTRLEKALWGVVAGLSHRAVESEIAKQTGFDLPPVSWALLEHLDSLGPMRVTDIAACHGVDISSVTPRLQALERLRLVTRGRDATDRRTSVISIGPAGRIALNQIHAARTKMLAELLGHADEAAINTVAAVLEQVLARTPSRG
jgi:DNA-binding MarR family transcriptional regulator